MHKHNGSRYVMYEETKYSMVTIFQRMAHSLAHCVYFNLVPTVLSLTPSRKEGRMRILGSSLEITMKLVRNNTANEDGEL